MVKDHMITGHKNIRLFNGLVFQCPVFEWWLKSVTFELVLLWSTYRASIKSGVEFLVDHFQSTFPRAKAFQVNTKAG
jgi:hypothetical protein